jgi:hypothetical protein
MWYSGIAVAPDMKNRVSVLDTEMPGGYCSSLARAGSE